MLFNIIVIITVSLCLILIAAPHVTASFSAETIEDNVYTTPKTNSLIVIL